MQTRSAGAYNLLTLRQASLNWSLIVSLFLLQRPPHATDNLRNPNRTRQTRSLMQLMHQVSPRLRPGLPRHRVMLRPYNSHNSISNKGHCGKVLPALLNRKHVGHLHP